MNKLINHRNVPSRCPRGSPCHPLANVWQARSYGRSDGWLRSTFIACQGRAHEVVFRSVGLAVELPGASPEGLRVLNWKNYVDPQVLADFERQMQIRVDYQTVTVAEELNAALASRARYDVVVPPHVQLARLILTGQLAALHLARLPSRGTVAPGFPALLAGVESANRYAVPLFVGCGRSGHRCAARRGQLWRVITQKLEPAVR